MATQKDPQLDALTKKSQNIMNTIKSSSTAGYGEQNPSLSDVTKQQQYIKTQDQIKLAKDAKLREAWYGKPDEGATSAEAQAEGSAPGFMGKAVDFISKPLYLMEGATEYALGKSNESSLASAMNKNASTNKRTFGDLTRETGIPGPISMPLGFILDVAFDPVNWVTAGTGALIPRVGAGLIKGTKKGGLAMGLKAAAKGAESRVLESTLTAGKVSSLWKLGAKKATGETVKEPGFVGKKLASAGNWMKSASISSADEYDKLTGRNFLETIGTRGTIDSLPSGYRLKVGDLIRAAGNSEKGQAVGANRWLKYWDIDNAEWTRLANVKDYVLKTMGSEERMKREIKALTMAKDSGMSLVDARKEIVAREAAIQVPLIEKAVKEAHEANPNVEEETAKWFDEWEMEGTDELPKSLPIEKMVETNPGLKPIAGETKTATDILNNPDIYERDAMFNGDKLAEEVKTGRVSLADLKDIIGRAELDETGWTFFDNLKKKATFFQERISSDPSWQKSVGEKMVKSIDVYRDFITAFKLSKVASSPTAWANAVVGNPTMAWMSGVNILDPLYMSHIKKAAGLMMNTDSGALWMRDLLDSTDIIKTLEDHPTLFQKTTGLSYKELQAKKLITDVLATAKDEGVAFEGMTVTDLAKVLSRPLQELTDSIQVLSGVNKNAANMVVGTAGEVLKKMKPSTASQKIAKQMSEGVDIAKSDLPTSFAANELIESRWVSSKLKQWEKEAAEGDLGSKILNLTYNKMAAGYEKIDQSYKFGTMTYLQQAGLTEKELRTVARNIKLDATDLTRVETDGVIRYQMRGEKALELANEIYLNYAAMPAAVQVLKNMPLLGSPFASFAYGMTLKTGKTALNNPAFFSRINSAMNDFSGEKSPLEKAALKNPMYEYLNDPTMFKIPSFTKSPFMEKNSMYLNLAGMLPFYSLNMFTQPNRKYNDLYSDAIVGTIDRSPFMKDPVMSTIFDYLIQPMIIKEGVTPLGSFGSPLYRSDAGAISKTGSFARTLAESVVPNVWGLPAGLGTRMIEGTIPGTEGLTSALPSYKGQQLSHALVGENRQGISGQEPAGSRTLRTVLGGLGVPVQTPVSFTNLPKDLKNKLK